MHLILRRIGLAIPTLLLLSFTVFVMLEITPGDTISAVLDDAADDAAAEAICEELACEASLFVRYGRYLSHLFAGDMGVSSRTGRDVADEISMRLPYTLTLAGSALMVAVIVGMSLGTLAALKRGTVWDTIITALTSIGTAAPTFWIALLLVALFSLQLGWLPVFGASTPRHFVLPVVSVAIALVPGITRITRSSVLETTGATFVLVAAAKGFSRRGVLWRHVRPAAAIPIVTYIGLQAVHLVSSLVAIEIIFNLPGLGGLAVQAALDRDPMLLQGVTLTIAALTFTILLVVDMLVLALDPRIARTTPAMT